MGAMMLIIAVLSAVYPPSSTGVISSTGIASIAMVYLEAGESSSISLKRVNTNRY